jgi:anion-transporting  ArsA/GET3 family ATPase
VIRRTERDEQQAQVLAEREAKVVGELQKILERLEADGTVVAFVEVFQQVKDDATAVQRRLGKIDLSQASLALQAELIETLKEMLEDLEEPQMS